MIIALISVEVRDVMPYGVLDISDNSLDVEFPAVIIGG